MRFSKLLKVKEGKLDRVKEWMDTLGGARRQEAIDTFDYEDVTREVFTLFKGHDGNYYVIGLNEVGVNPRPSDKSVKINQEHSAFKSECLEPISENGEVL